MVSFFLTNFFIISESPGLSSLRTSHWQVHYNVLFVHLNVSEHKGSSKCVWTQRSLGTMFPIIPRGHIDGVTFDSHSGYCNIVMLPVIGKVRYILCLLWLGLYYWMLYNMHNTTLIPCYMDTNEHHPKGETMWFLWGAGRLPRTWWGYQLTKTVQNGDPQAISEILHIEYMVVCCIEKYLLHI